MSKRQPGAGEANIFHGWNRNTEYALGVPPARLHNQAADQGGQSRECDRGLDRVQAPRLAAANSQLMSFASSALT